MGYNLKETEPAGTGVCTECKNERYVWSDTYKNGKYKNIICMPCLHEIDEKHVEAALEGYEDYIIEDKKVIFEIGYGLRAYWTFTEEKVDTTKNPNKQNIIIQPSVNKQGTVLHEGEELTKVTIESYRETAEKLARKEYEERY